MADNRKRYPPPFSLRLSSDERAALERAAGNMPLGAYIRSKILGESQTARLARRPAPVKDYKVLAQLLGELGRSRLASNLNQLARAANTGSLPITPETEAALRQACTEIRRIRSALMRALGFTGEGHRDP